MTNGRLKKSGMNGLCEMSSSYDFVMYFLKVVRPIVSNGVCSACFGTGNTTYDFIWLRFELICSSSNRTGNGLEVMDMLQFKHKRKMENWMFQSNIACENV